jgi:hypothetical protein
LLQHITDEYQSRYGEQSNVALSQQEITGLLYRHDVAQLRDEVVEYLKFKKGLFLLFDNLDKGWSTHGLVAADITVLRALLDATRKVERHIHRHEIRCVTLVFLRNDVYELLVSESPDRGKEGRVALDWSDSDLLRELVRRRLIYADMPDRTFDDLWRRICVSHVNGEETSQYLIDRSLMRPRSLIDLLNHCRGFAVNLGHQKLQAQDIEKGLAAFSSDLVVDIGYEIRDIMPAAANVLYAFIEQPPILAASKLIGLMEETGVSGQTEDVLNVLLWYAVLGIRRADGATTYIYTVNYDMPILKAIMRKQESDGLVFVVNPAFVPGLQMLSQH